MIFRKKPVVLIVEDDENTLKLLDLYVQWAGYKTVLATNGREALRIVKEQEPVLVVVDIMLPEVHGIQVCHEIKSDPETKDIPVMVVSVKNFPADRKQVEEAGADLFMSKPLEEKDFAAAVKKLVDGKSGFSGF